MNAKRQNDIDQLAARAVPAGRRMIGDVRVEGEGRRWQCSRRWTGR